MNIYWYIWRNQIKLIMVLTEEMIKKLPVITEEELRADYFSNNEEIMEEAKKELLRKDTFND